MRRRQLRRMVVFPRGNDISESFTSHCIRSELCSRAPDVICSTLMIMPFAYMKTRSLYSMLPLIYFFVPHWHPMTVSWSFSGLSLRQPCTFRCGDAIIKLASEQGMPICGLYPTEQAYRCPRSHPDLVPHTEAIFTILSLSKRHTVRHSAVPTDHRGFAQKEAFSHLVADDLSFNEQGKLHQKTPQ